MASAQIQSAPSQATRPFRFMDLPQELRDQVLNVLVEIDGKMIPRESAELYHKDTKIHLESGLHVRYAIVSRAFQQEYLSAIDRRRRAGYVKMSIWFPGIRSSWIPFGYCNRKILKDVTDLEVTFPCETPCVRFERQNSCELDDICSCGHFLAMYARQVDMLLEQMPLRATPNFRCVVRVQRYCVVLFTARFVAKWYPEAPALAKALENMRRVEGVSAVEVDELRTPPRRG